LLRYIVRRLGAAIPILLFLSMLVFVLVDLAPGDTAAALAGENATPELITAVRHQLHLDDPLPVRYVHWLGGAVHGDFGSSIVTKLEVRPTIIARIPITASIGLLALGASLIFGFTLGVLAAIRPGGHLDRGIVALSSFLVAVPPFVLALVLVVQLSVYRSWLPSVGYVAFTQSPWEWFRHLAIPAFCTSALFSSEITLQLRAALVDNLDKDFVLAARARGLRGRSVLFRHALRSALIPVVTILGPRIALLLGSTAIVEQIFAINGVGTLALQSTSTHDINMLLGIVMIVATTVLVMNAMVDIINGFLNPKMRVR
jgi:peptide/nickel transport system permease protein